MIRIRRTLLDFFSLSWSSAMRHKAIAMHRGNFPRLHRFNDFSTSFIFNSLMRNRTTWALDGIVVSAEFQCYFSSLSIHFLFNEW